jgi:hypothetical protein
MVIGVLQAGGVGDHGFPCGIVAKGESVMVRPERLKNRIALVSQRAE